MNHQPKQLHPIWVILLGLCLFYLAGCSSAAERKPATELLKPAPFPVGAIEKQAPANPPDTIKGGLIYASKCQPCHGDSGQGNGPRATQIKAQGGQVAKLVSSALATSASPASWFDTITVGRIDKLMPGFSQSLTPQDRWDVLSYIWAMGVHTPTLPAIQQTYIEQCQSCHGSTGQGNGPNLGTAKVASFADTSWVARTSLADISTAMLKGIPHAQISLTEPVRLEMANLVRTFGYRYATPSLATSVTIAGNATLQLQAINRTPNGSAVTGLPVVLHTYDTNGEVFSQTVPLDAQGVATFAGLPSDPGLFFQADLTYSGAKFYAPPVQFSNTLQLSDTLSVYDITTDPDVITVSEFHYFVQEVGEGMAKVIEFYIFENSSDRAYIDKPGPDGSFRSLKVTLPADAVNLKFDGPGLGSRFSQDGQTIYDGDAVPPGQRAATIAMIYDMPYRSSKVISRKMAYPVKKWDVFLPDNVMRITGLTDKGLQPIQTSSIRWYVPENSMINAGGDAVFTITGQPRSIQLPGEDRTAAAVGFVALILALAGAVYMVTRVRRWHEMEIDIAKDRSLLLKAISDLDARFASGNTDESEYRATRSKLKQELRDIWE